MKKARIVIEDLYPDEAEKIFDAITKDEKLLDNTSAWKFIEYYEDDEK